MSPSSGNFLGVGGGGGGLVGGENGLSLPAMQLPAMKMQLPEMNNPFKQGGSMDFSGSMGGMGIFGGTGRGESGSAAPAPAQGSSPAGLFGDAGRGGGFMGVPMWQSRAST
jgi:hypothetical protein